MNGVIKVLVALGLFGALGAGPLAAQTEKIAAGHDSDLPIEITADTLEVRQTESLAIFRGEVDAVQGDMLLRADVLVVHYRDNEENPEQPGISRIDAEGNVFVSSPDETAQGERGVYDVDNQKIELAGDVVLTRGDNVIKGQQLELDLETGKSQVLSTVGPDGKRERVRGLFVPQKDKN